jgi:hypothetical protein
MCLKISKGTLFAGRREYVLADQEKYYETILKLNFGAQKNL